MSFGGPDRLSTTYQESVGAHTSIITLVQFFKIILDKYTKEEKMILQKQFIPCYVPFCTFISRLKMLLAFYIP